MAIRYLWNGGVPTNDGTSWNNAYLTMSAALAAMSPGDTLWVASDHTESTAGAVTLTSPGTASQPVRILCASGHTGAPPTTLGTGAVVATTGPNNITTAGYAYIYGVSFNLADGVSAGTFNGRIWRFDNCTISLAGTGSAARITIGVANAVDSGAQLINCTLRFSNASQALTIPGGALLWRGGSVANVAPTVLMVLTANGNSSAEIVGVDLSLLSGKSLITPTTTLWAAVNLRNCKLPATFTVLGSVLTTQQARVNVDNCDGGNTNYKMARYAYQGSIIADTAHIRTGGANDGTTSLSHTFTTLATGPTQTAGLEGPWITIWNDVADGTTSKTVTVELCTEGTTLFDDDVYFEVEYPGTSGFPQAATATTRIMLETTTHQSLASRFGSTSASWTGFTTPTAQRLRVTVVPQQKGVIRARVVVAKPGATVYIDPMITVT